MAMFLISSHFVSAEEVNWEAFLGRHDPLWTQTPRGWIEGAYLGNGLLGAMIYGDGAGGLQWEMGRGDVVDHRPGRNNPLFNEARLPIGRFHLTPAGGATNSTLRLHLWNAEVSGECAASGQPLRWRSYLHADDPVLWVELESSPQAAGWRFAPAVSESERVYGKGRPKGYVANPAPERRTTEDGIELCFQPLTAGGGYATAWRRSADGRRIAATLGYSRTGRLAEEEALTILRRAWAESPEAARSRHRAWWHAYYPRSFLSLPDTRLEGFYWLQMYRLGCASRPDRPAMDLLGPWYHPTLWPAMWWNLNMQLAYAPVYMANRLEQGENYARLLEAGTSNLVANAQHYHAWKPPADAAALPRATSASLNGGMWKGEKGCPETGNLLWACHNYWRQCRYAGDDRRLTDHMLPLLAAAVRFHLHIAVREADGKLHLPCTYSPEIAYTTDCNYDLAGWRWGLETLVAEHARLGREHPELPRWREALADLTDFPADANGLRIGRDVGYTKSHRHYSHLIMIYPLHVLHPGLPDRRKLIETSIRHWTSMPGAFIGYSYAGAASLHSLLGEGDAAVAFLHQGLDRQITANGMYVEAYDSPCLESPFAAAQSVHELLLQCHGGRVHVFPALPTSWPDAVFRDLRVEGAFLISARRSAGRTLGVRVHAERGGDCRVVVEGREHRLNLPPGEVAWIGERVADFTPLAGNPEQFHRFGTRSLQPRRAPSKPMPLR
jgi:hypothetical protein